jgi:hypothetical protein
MLDKEQYLTKPAPLQWNTVLFQHVKSIQIKALSLSRQHCPKGHTRSVYSSGFLYSPVFSPGVQFLERLQRAGESSTGFMADLQSMIAGEERLGLVVT